jgi:hypothetical protein
MNFIYDLSKEFFSCPTLIMGQEKTWIGIFGECYEPDNNKCRANALKFV